MRIRGSSENNVIQLKVVKGGKMRKQRNLLAFLCLLELALIIYLKY